MEDHSNIILLPLLIWQTEQLQQDCKSIQTAGQNFELQTQCIWSSIILKIQRAIVGHVASLSMHVSEKKKLYPQYPNV